MSNPLSFTRSELWTGYSKDEIKLGLQLFRTLKKEHNITSLTDKLLLHGAVCGWLNSIKEHDTSTREGRNTKDKAYSKFTRSLEQILKRRRPQTPETVKTNTVDLLEAGAEADERQKVVK